MIVFNGEEYKSRNNLSYENYYINIESDLDYSEFLEKLMDGEINVEKISLCDKRRLEYPTKSFLSSSEYKYLESVSNKLYKNEFLYDMIEASNDTIVYGLITRMNKFLDGNGKYINLEYYSSPILDYSDDKQVLEFFEEFKKFNNNANIKTNIFEDYKHFVNTMDYEAFKEFMKLYNSELRYFSKTNLFREFDEATSDYKYLDNYNESFIDDDYYLKKEDLDIKASEKIMKTFKILDDDFFIQICNSKLENSNHNLPYNDFLKLSLIAMQKDICKTPEEFFRKRIKNFEEILEWKDTEILFAAEKLVEKDELDLKKKKILAFMGDAYGLFEDFVEYREQTGKNIDEIKKNCQALHSFEQEYLMFNANHHIACKDFDFFDKLTSKEKEFINEDINKLKRFEKVKVNYPRENLLITRNSMAFEHFIDNKFATTAQVFDIYYNYPNLRDAFKGNDYISSEEMNEFFRQMVASDKPTMFLEDFNTVFKYCQNKVENKEDFVNLFRKTLYNLDSLNNFLVNKIDLKIDDNNIYHSYEGLKYRKHLLLNDKTLDMISNGILDKELFKEIVYNNFENIKQSCENENLSISEKKNLISKKIINSSFMEKSDLVRMFEENFRGNVPKVIGHLEYLAKNSSLNNHYIVQNFKLNSFRNIVPFKNAELMELAYYVDMSQIQKDKILVLAENINENNVFKFIEMKDVIKDVSNVLSKNDFNNFCSYLRYTDINKEDFIHLKNYFSELSMNEKVDLIKDTVNNYFLNVRSEMATHIFDKLKNEYGGELTQHKLKDCPVQNGILTARILSKGEGLKSKDTIDLILAGEDTYCCFTLDGASEDSLWYAISSDKSSVWVIQDDKGKTLAQAWVWESEDKSTLVFDNIEFSNNRDYKTLQEIICDYCEQSPYENIHMGTRYTKVSLGAPLEIKEQKKLPWDTYSDYNYDAEVLKRDGQVLFTDEKNFKEIQAEDKEDKLNIQKEEVVGSEII